jgi:hypothetical protein
LRCAALRCAALRCFSLRCRAFSSFLHKQLCPHAGRICSHRPPSAAGVDIEPIATFADLAAKQAFITRNFTPKEIAYANSVRHVMPSHGARTNVHSATCPSVFFCYVFVCN